MWNLFCDLIGIVSIAKVITAINDWTNLIG